MRQGSKWAAMMAAGMIALTSAMPLYAAESAAADVKTESQVMAELGVLQGEGSGVTAAYLAKSTTRIQAAILFLRLKGLEQAALAFKGSDQFADADQVSDGNKAVMAYLKANPELGWTGTGNGYFDPLAGVTAQQYYKVLLDALGHKQDIDFKYDDVISYAKSQGLSRIADAGALRNSHIAAATVEALTVKIKGGDKTLAASLAEHQVIGSGQASLAQAARIQFGHRDDLGSYLIDGHGRTLYYFTKDSTNASACKDQCAVNWPAFYADRLIVPDEMSAGDFRTIVREDGGKQTTYKGMPLYYFIKDEKAGDVNGQGFNGVWYVASSTAAGQAEQPAVSSGKAYAMDISGFAFAKPEITIEAGASITFTNKDSIAHNVVSDRVVDGKPLFESPMLGKGESYTLTLDQPGEYTYYCAPHKASMKGKIIVK